MNNNMRTDALTTYALNYPKIRLGRDYDGGYVIYDLPGGYTHFLSGGAGYDISFEEDFIKKYDVSCTLFDPVGVTSRGNLTKINLVKEKLRLIDPTLLGDDCFVKVDIEGDEIDFFDNLDIATLWRFKQLVIEFHLFIRQDSWDILRKLTKTHILGHVHANNCNTRMYSIDDVDIPACFECTYVRRDMIDECVRNNIALPSNIDRANNPNAADIVLDGLPFVHTHAVK